MSAIAVTAMLSFASPSLAAKLTVAFDAEISSLDPHFHNNLVNVALDRSLYDALTTLDEKQQPAPALAESWEMKGPKEWLFKLRKDVKFSDGSPMTAADVVYSLNRPATIEKSPSSYKIFVAAIDQIKVIDDYTLSITTKNEAPLLPLDLRRVYISSKEQTEKLTTEAINAGNVNIGTGPYVATSWVRGDRLELKANPYYYGGKPKWDNVTIRFIKAPAARLAAVLSGDVDVAQGILPSDKTRLESNSKFTVVSAPTSFMYFFQPYVGPKVQPYIKTNDGKPIDPNPLANPDVRRAMAKALDKQAIINALLDGNAAAAGQILLKGLPAYSPNLPVSDYHPDEAKALLAKAGFPEGFQLTMHCGNDRVLYGDKMCLAYAQMLSRIGIKTNVETMPHLVWVPKVNARDYSLAMRFWDFGSGEPSEMFKVNYHTKDETKDMGLQNRGEYSNPALDKDIERALAMTDANERNKLFQAMTETIVGDGGLIPLLHSAQIWAMSKNIHLEPNSDGFTIPESITPAQAQ
jgi:peptide/nickel transport system substrate-binding protein